MIEDSKSFKNKPQKQKIMRPQLRHFDHIVRSIAYCVSIVREYFIHKETSPWLCVGRDLYRATATVTRHLGLLGHIQRTSCLISTYDKPGSTRIHSDLDSHGILCPIPWGWGFENVVPLYPLPVVKGDFKLEHKSRGSVSQQVWHEKKSIAAQM